MTGEEGRPARPERPDRPRPPQDSALARRLREVEGEIFARRPEHAVEPTLDRISALATLLGDPQRAYPVIHVTGTNGKTSTARMIETLLRARGLRTGLFTSPHLSNVRERIAVERGAAVGGGVPGQLRRRRAVCGAGRTSASRCGCPSSRC